MVGTLELKYFSILVNIFHELKLYYFKTNKNGLTLTICQNEKSDHTKYRKANQGNKYGRIGLFNPIQSQSKYRYRILCSFPTSNVIPYITGLGNLREET